MSERWRLRSYCVAWVAFWAIFITLAVVGLPGCGSDGQKATTSSTPKPTTVHERTGLEQVLTAACGAGTVRDIDSEYNPDTSSYDYRYAITCSDGTVRIIDK